MKEEIKYEEFSEEMLDKILKELTLKQPKRKMKIGVGKLGYIEYRIAILDYIGASEKEKDSLREKLDKELDDGCYIIES